MKSTNAKWANTLSDDLFKYIDDELSDKDINHIKYIVGNDNGHSNIHSDDKSDVDVLNRMLMEQRDINGKFTSNKHQWETIRTILDWKSENIYDDLDCINNNQNLTYSISDIGSFDDKPLGYGFILVNGFYHKFESENASIVLKKDSTCPYGFHLQTAFPGTQGTASMQKDKLTILQDDCSSIMIQTDYYKKASPAKQAFLRYISNPKNALQARYTPPSIKNDYMETITLYKKNKDGTSYRAYITDSEIKVSKFDTNNKATQFDMAQKLAHKNRLDLTSSFNQKAFAEIEPGFTEIITSVYQSIQNNLQEKDKSKKLRQLPNIINSQSNTSYEY